MSSHDSILKGSATLALGQVTSQAFSFIRNIIIARLISPRDFGIAATLAVTISIFELMSNLSADKLLIQAPDGDEAAFQNTAHAVHAVRGVMNALLIFALGGPASRLFGEPRARWAFELIALYPLIRSFLHLDTSRLQREMRFRPSVTMDVGSQAIMIVAALPLAFWLRDYRAMVWLLVLQAASATVVSHLVAERNYGWAWQRAYLRRIASFGWPLLVNGLLLFVIMDGDRFLIGSARRLFPASRLTLTDLGIYSVAFALTMGPANLVSNLSTSIFLPLLSRVQTVRSSFERRYAACSQILAVLGAAMAISFLLLGGRLVVLIYGMKYAAASAFIAWLGAMWSLRAVRVSPTSAALALGDSRNSMYANIARTVALAGVLIAVATGAGLVWIAISGFGGEVCALMVCVARLRLKHGVPVSLFVKPVAVYAASVLAACAAAASGLGVVASLGMTAGLAALAFAAMLVAFPQFRTDIGGLSSIARFSQTA